MGCIVAKCPDCERDAPISIDGEFWPHDCVESVAVVIGRSRDGHPRHQLMLAYDTPLEPLERLDLPKGA